MKGLVQFLKAWAVPLILLILVAVFLLSGYRLVAVVSGSMEPTIPVWSLCLADTNAAYEDIQVGDVVVYIRRSDGKRIIHRVVEITDQGMVTKGDANAISDGVSTGPDNLFAKYLGHVRWLGRLSQLYRTPAGIAVVAVLLGVLGFLSFSDGKKKKGQPEKNEAAAEKAPPADEEP